MPKCERATESEFAFVCAFVESGSERAFSVNTPINYLGITYNSVRFSSSLLKLLYTYNILNRFALINVLLTVSKRNCFNLNLQNTCTKKLAIVLVSAADSFCIYTFRLCMGMCVCEHTGAYILLFLLTLKIHKH